MRGFEREKAQREKEREIWRELELCDGFGRSFGLEIGTERHHGMAMPMVIEGGVQCILAATIDRGGNILEEEAVYCLFRSMAGVPLTTKILEQ